MVNLKLSSKVLLYFILIAILPLFVVTFFLVNLAQSQLLKSAETKQQIIASDTAQKVDNYLAGKINTLVFESRLYSARSFNDPVTKQNMAVLIKQDQNIDHLSLLDTTGQEQLVFDRNGQVTTLTNEANSDAFKAVNYLSGRAFVGSVSYDSQNDPIITIAVPVLRSDFSQHLNNLPSANFGTYNSPADILGTLVANYNISDLWQSVLSTKIGQGGYAYVVDGLGNLVAHPEKNFLKTHQNIASVAAVNEFINGQFDTTETASETGKKVISTPRKLTNTNWAVIVEEPVSSIYSGVNSFIKLAALIILSAAALSVLASLIFRYQLIQPIRKLTYGAKQLGSGNFDYKIILKAKDELRELANTFNSMSSNIKQLVSNLQSKNVSLVTEQTKLNSIISSVSDGIVALNNRSQIITINPPAAKLVQKTPKELYGQALANLYPWERDNRPFVPELSKPGLYHYPDIVLNRGSEVFYLDLLVSVIDNKDSEVTAIISIHDLTKSRELDFMKLDFIAIAAHELRTPLTIIQGYLSQLNDDALKELSMHNVEVLQKAFTGTTQLRNLINELLSIARIERGEFEINISKLNLSLLVKNVVDEHTPSAAQKKQHLTCQLTPTESVYVPGDAASITEVLNNLIGNALKYTKNGGHVRVNLTTEGGEVRVEVADDGPGIPEALRARLFTKFYRAESSLTAGTRGTGLGLYISKTIIEMHHGRIGIAPDSGQGSVFYFTLPIFDEAKHAGLITDKTEVGGVHGWFKKHNAS